VTWLLLFGGRSFFRIITMKKQPIHVPDNMPEAYNYEKPVPFSRGMQVQLPGFTLVFVSGTASVDREGRCAFKGDLAKQARKTFDNLTAVLMAGGAAWKDVVKLTIFLRDMKDYDEFNIVRNAFFREVGLDPFPASTCVEARLCWPDLLCEIEMIAVVPGEPG
jgi:enamine deaminase RidA (YjgF/YER057c/UK114 family)